MGHLKADARPGVRRGIESAKEKYSRSSARYLSRRLVALDFMNQAMALAGTVLLCVFPFLIVMSALLGRSAASTFSRHLGLDQRAAADMGHLFNSSGSTSSSVTTLCIALVALFAFAAAKSVQQLYQRIFQLEARGTRDFARRAIWWGLVVGWLVLVGLVGPWARARGPVLYGIVVLVGFTGFWWFAMWFLMGGRITWRRLLPSAVATGLCWLGMSAVFSITFSGMVISSEDRYGPIGIVLDLLSYTLAVSVVIILGAVLGIVWRERGLSFRAAVGRLRRTR